MQFSEQKMSKLTHQFVDISFGFGSIGFKFSVLDLIRFGGIYWLDRILQATFKMTPDFQYIYFNILRCQFNFCTLTTKKLI